MKRVAKAVLPVAGTGSRMLPATKAVPKELVTIVDTPALQLVVEEIVEAGITDILFITSHDKEAIARHFSPGPELEAELIDAGKPALAERLAAISKLAHFEYVFQPEPLGLGHAVSLAKQFVGDDMFAVVLPDELVLTMTPILPGLIEVAEEHQATTLAYRRVDRTQMFRYGNASGRMLNNSVFRVEQMVEKPSPRDVISEWAVMGRYVFCPDMFDALARTHPGYDGEIHLTDAQRLLLEEGVEQFGFIVEQPSVDVGNPVGFVLANVEWALQRPDIADEVRRLLLTSLSK